eukprot:2385439-Amphidinium_carterae.1
MHPRTHAPSHPHTHAPTHTRTRARTSVAQLGLFPEVQRTKNTTGMRKLLTRFGEGNDAMAALDTMQWTTVTGRYCHVQLY